MGGTLKASRAQKWGRHGVETMISNQRTALGYSKPYCNASQAIHLTSQHFDA